MERFVDRTEELATLEDEYRRSGSALVVLYGRRRVGKTTLLSRFIKNRKALFFLASEESESINRALFKERAADFTGNELLREADIKSWDAIFKAIVVFPCDEKKIIVIDEFQYLGKSNPAFPSVFQRIWEEQLKSQNVMVVLCGSLISMMCSQTLAYDSPLYGRRTAQICLKQIPFSYYGEFFPKKSLREQIEWYAVTGGVPKYIELFGDEDNLYDSIKRHVLNRSGYLYDEPFFLLQQEVTEIGSYFSIIRAIAAGNTKLSSIARMIEVKATSLTKYLKTLIDLELLEREVPVTEKNPEKSKKGLYRIKDNYIRFWFAFVYPNMSFIESNNEQIVMSKIKANLVDGHISYIYEDVCREYMWQLNAKGTWNFTFSKIGRWWDSKDEIDIAAVDEEGSNLILGECKFWKNPVGRSVLDRLEQKAPSVKWRNEKRKVFFVLFSVSGFTEDLVAIANQREDILLVPYGYSSGMPSSE